MLGRLLTTASIVVLALSEATFAQAPDTLWTRSLGIGQSNYGSWVIEDNGGFVVCGMTAGRASNACPDMYLAKTDLQGNMIWQRTYGGNLSETGRYVAKTGDGGYIIVGETYSYGKADFESPDIYLVKTDAGGNEQWYRTFDWGRGHDYGDCVRQTRDGGYVICGAMSDKIAVIKTDASGNETWRRYYGSSTSEAYSLAETPDRGFILAGCDYNEPGFFWGGCIIKLDSAGVAQWKRNYRDTDMLTVYGVALTSDGGYIMTGLVGTDHNFNIALKKANGLGEDEWTQYFDRGTWDWGFSAEQTADGGYIVAGYTDNGDIYDSDAYIVKTDAAGGMVWDLAIGNARSDLVRCVHELDSGGYIACGYIHYDTGESPAKIWLLRLDGDAALAADPEASQPMAFAIYGAYPNPFNAVTAIRYSLPASSPIRIVVYDMLGRPLQTILETVQDAGSHDILWDASTRASGVYFYRLETNLGSQTGKMTLLK